MSKQFDVAIIGGGPGGYTAAIRLAQLGKKCILIEKDQIGGTCLNRGCIPTKSLLHSAEIYRTVKEAGKYGVKADTPEFAYKKFSEKKDSVVSKLRQGVAYLEKKAGVEVVKGTASFKDAKTLLIGEEEIIADNIIIATGSIPSTIPIPGIQTPGVIDSDAALSMTECPKSIVIIGGGVIGVEFATLYLSLDVKVTIIEMLPELLPPVDAEIAALMRRELTKNGVDIFVNAKVTSVEPGIIVHFEHDGNKSVQADTCIVAVGRKPVTDGLNLESAGVMMNRGFIEVDDHMRTNISGIYAIGDVTGKMQLAHVASAQGLVAAHNITGQDKTMRYDVIPSCVYSSPEIAGVGLTESQAKEKGHGINIGRFMPAANGRSLIMGETSGSVKIITDKGSGQILGCHMMAPRATDIIGELCAFMNAQGTIETLCDTVHAHPTVSEMIMEAAHDTEKLCVNK